MKKSVLKENLFVVVVVVFCLFGGGGGCSRRLFEITLWEAKYKELRGGLRLLHRTVYV